MNRRGFLSMLAGAAGATLVPWRGLKSPVIILPARPEMTLAELMESTWRKYSAQLVDNVVISNPVYRRYSGFEVINIPPREVLTAAEWTWSQAPVVIV